MIRASGLAMMLLIAACSPQPRAAEFAGASLTGTAHPVSGLPVVSLSITGRDRRVHRFRVEVARSGAEQARGLMFRETMGADEGMLFPRDPPDLASFWMRNTPLALDILFIGRDRRIINIAAATVPFSDAPIRSADFAAAVLELNAGRAAALGIEPGDKVDW